MGRSLSVIGGRQRSRLGAAWAALLALILVVSPAWASNPVDRDGNGKFEEWVLQDWDGDGSGWTRCTGHNLPASEPACKVAGQRIYRDWIDDVNAVIHGTGALPGQMELNGTIFLPEGSLVSWPCYDARWPTGFNDPRSPSRVWTSGTATAGGATTLTDSGASFLQAGVIVGNEIALRKGDADAEFRRISAVTATQITVSDAWVSNPVAADAYEIIEGAVWHDELSDPAIEHCAKDETGTALINFAPRAWQGTIQGAGADERKNDTGLMGAGTDRPNGPLGTTIHQDYGTDDNSPTGFFGRSGWFNQEHKNRHIPLGITPEPETSTTWVGAGGLQSWTETSWAEHNGTVTSGFSLAFTDTGASFVVDRLIGYTVVIREGDADEERRQIIDNNATTVNIGTAWASNPVATDTYRIFKAAGQINGKVCLCNTATCAGSFYRAEDGSVADDAFIDQLNKNDILIIESQPASTSAADTWDTFLVLDDGTNFTEDCGTAAGEAYYVHVGSWAPEESTSVAIRDWSVSSINARKLKDGMDAGRVDPSYFQSQVTIRDLVIEAQDYPGEVGGDCGTTFDQPWTKGATPTALVNPSDDWHECDTGHLAAHVGPGRNTFERVVFKHGSQFNVDGIGHPHTDNLIRDSKFLWPRGMAVIDGPWNLEDVTVQYGTFHTEAMSEWVGPQTVDGLRILDSAMRTVAIFEPGYGYKTFRNVTLDRNVMEAPFWIRCDNRGLRFENIRINGWSSIPEDYPVVIGPGGVANSMLYFDCDDPELPITGNVFSGLTLSESIGNVVGVEQLDILTQVSALRGNIFRDLVHQSDGELETDCAAAGVPYPACVAENNGGVEYSTVCLRDRSTGGVDDGESAILAANFFDGIFSTAPGVFRLGATSGSCNAGNIDAADGLAVGSCASPGGATRCPHACGVMTDGDVSDNTLTTDCQ